MSRLLKLGQGAPLGHITQPPPAGCCRVREAVRAAKAKKVHEGDEAGPSQAAEGSDDEAQRDGGRDGGGGGDREGDFGARMRAKMEARRRELGNEPQPREARGPPAAAAAAGKAGGGGGKRGRGSDEDASDDSSDEGSQGAWVRHPSWSLLESL
jgi:hypothetical protein